MTADEVEGVSVPAPLLIALGDRPAIGLQKFSGAGLIKREKTNNYYIYTMVQFHT